LPRRASRRNLETMSTDVPSATDRARALFSSLAAGRWDEAGRQCCDHLRLRVVPDRLAHGWSRAVESVGGFVGMGEPTARQAGDYAVVEVPLTFRAGRGTARVAYDRDGKAAGLSLECRRRHRLDPRAVRAFALRSPEVADLITLGPPRARA
jgi:Protein of unknown function (DUF3887)